MLAKEISVIAGRALMVLTLIFGGLETFAQQRMQFTQYMFNGLLINPAYAGADEALSLTFIQRSQWADVEAAPTTQTFSAHTLFKQKHLGLGLSVINDEIGVHRNLSALTNYAYHLKVAEKAYFSMGLLAGVHNRRSDYASLIGEGNYDPKLSNPMISETYFDFGMGMYFRTPKLHLGLSVPELIPATYQVNDTLSIDLNESNYLFFSKYRMQVNKNLAVEPGFLIKYLAGVPVSYDINVNVIFHEVLTTGLSYRKQESVDFLLKGQITPQLQFGYAYDYPISEISRLSSGSHELMINYVFRYTRRNIASPR